MLPLLDGMTLLALVGIVDPPRPAARVSIADAHSAGIQVRMITGDHAVTAEAIAKDLGIRGRAITGAEFRAMSDDEALGQLDDIGVIARVTPEDKVHLVDLLRLKGHIVAMTGDGVNDAPALKKADIGVAMGITGTEVSKEAANMILTDDDFSTIVKAVELGRGLYDNLKKYIRFQVGLLIGYIFTFLGSSILNVLGGVPFFPLQTLFMNFTIQVFQAVGLGYGKPSIGLMERKPRPATRRCWAAADRTGRCLSGDASRPRHQQQSCPDKHGEAARRRVQQQLAQGRPSERHCDAAPCAGHQGDLSDAPQYHGRAQENTDPEYIANPDEKCMGESIRLSVAADAKTYNIVVGSKGKPPL